MGASGLPSAQDAAAALSAAYRAKHAGAEPPRNAVVLPLAQLLAEGSLSAYFLGTNNLGAMHATSAFSRAHKSEAGYGMVAFLDHAPGPAPYIARMAVYPSLAAGARALLELLEHDVSLSAISTTSDYATALYAHGYFEGTASPATPIAARASVWASGSWTPADRTNIAAYGALIDAHTAAAGAAFDSLSSYAGDAEAQSSGPPFASLADRLTPAPEYAPHTLEHARVLLGAEATTPLHGISLDEALSTPAGDGVWLFGGAPAVASTRSSRTTSSDTAALALLLTAVALGAAALGSAMGLVHWPGRVAVA